MFPGRANMTSCDKCGVLFYRSVAHLHECDPDKLVDHEVKQAIENFDPDLELMLLLVTPEGKFAEWLAHNR